MSKYTIADYVKDKERIAELDLLVQEKNAEIEKIKQKYAGITKEYNDTYQRLTYNSLGKELLEYHAQHYIPDNQ
ncbi:MAG: hypothetical protein WC679_02590 [Bacteroidales bacterium]|jgi:hypothetical protein